MASYLFRCANCGEELTIERQGFRPEPGDCPRCATSMLEHVIQDRGGAQGEREGKRSRAGSGYHATLARFPNDPQAYVESPGQLQKLVDQRRREGWGDPIRGEDVAKAAAPKKPKREKFRDLTRGEG